VSALLIITAIIIKRSPALAEIADRTAYDALIKQLMITSITIFSHVRRNINKMVKKARYNK